MAPPPPHFTIDHKIEDQIGWGVDHFLRDIATHAAKIKHICTLASSRHIEDSSGANHKRQQCVREDDDRETHNSFYDRHLASCDILSRYNKRIYVEQGPSFTEDQNEFNPNSIENLNSEVSFWQKLPKILEHCVMNLEIRLFANLSWLGDRTWLLLK